MIKCELCKKKIAVSPYMKPLEHEFTIDAWAFCPDCKIKLLNGVTWWKRGKHTYRPKEKNE